MEWYEITNVAEIDTPFLAVYKQRVQENIDALLQAVDNNTAKLRPHVKTNKIPEVCSMMLQNGIQNFKCATIAEAEMLAMIGAPDVMIAYQPVGPKVTRLLKLVKQYRSTHFSCIIDDVNVAGELSDRFLSANEQADVYLDINTGMNRTGMRPAHALQLLEIFQALGGIRIIGLHTYDGHIRDRDIDMRSEKCNDAFASVESLQNAIYEKTGLKMKIVAGGSPTFSIHALRENVECSPGTFVFWDWGYNNIIQEAPFKFAALVVTRVISLPDADTVCTDLGHKSIAAENPFPRVHFLNVPGAEPISQSEEHLILRVSDSSLFTIGDILYGVPVHICPTVALYDTVKVVEDNYVENEWSVLSRNRSIKI